MPDFAPLNLAQLYQSADASVAQAMQTNLLVLQSQHMKQEYDTEDALRSLAKRSTVTDETGTTSFDLPGFTQKAYGVDPLKAMAFEKSAIEAKKAALDITKTQGEIQNTQEQIDERRMKNAGDRLKLMNEASTVPYLKYKELIDKGTPEEEARKQVQPLYEAAQRNIITSGFFKQEQLQAMKVMNTQQFDPTIAEAGMRQVLGAKDSLAQYWEERKFNQAERFHGDQMTMEIRGQNITMRGQDLTDARAKETLAQQGLEVKETGDGNFIIIDKKNNDAETVVDKAGKPVQGKSNLTESQGKAVGFGQRAVEAHNLILGLEASGTFGRVAGAKQTIENLPLVGGIAGGAVNTVVSGDQQKYEQAKRDFLNAVLRPESGATITPEEFKNADKQYFPQSGDTPAVIKQKQEAREREINTLKAMAGQQGAKQFPEIKRPKGGNEASGKVTPAGQVSVSAPDGKTYVFATQEAADKFKKAAGIQ